MADTFNVTMEEITPHEVTFLTVQDPDANAVTATDSAEINFTITGQDITASLIAGSIDETKLDASVNASLDLADSALQPADLSSYVQAGDNVSDLTNDSGFITSYTVTEGDVTAHETALEINESQISDLGSYVKSDTSSDGITGSSQVINVVSCTQAEYDAGTPVAGTLYIIED